MSSPSVRRDEHHLRRKMIFDMISLMEHKLKKRRHKKRELKKRKLRKGELKKGERKDGI